MKPSAATALLPAGYSIERRQLQAGGIAVQLFTVADPNQLAMAVAGDDFAADERLPYWADLWPSAFALAEFLARRGRLDGVDVIELGCGMGLAGTVAALLGADVLFTDFEPDALAFAAANHALNTGTPGSTRLVDWRDDPLAIEAPLVIGADVLYERRFIDPFLHTLTRVVAPSGTALVAEPDRQIALGTVERLAAEGFSHDLHLEEVMAGEAAKPVWIHELVAPPA